MEVNISPLVDVVFLLLVFFVLSGTLMRESEVPVKLPHSQGNAEQAQSRPRVITVTAQGKILLDGNITQIARIKSLNEKGALDSCTIRIDQDAPAGILVEVLSVLPSAGIRVSGEGQK
ncbi:MAG: biopolymer transporter ExbD [Victivallales bacterium]|nr:biopolymer transporter ExbD [Victivallales bacterium]